VTTPSESKYDNALSLNLQTNFLILTYYYTVRSCDNYILKRDCGHNAHSTEMRSTFTNLLATSWAFIKVLGHIAWAL